MGIAVQVSPTVQIRRLHSTGLTADDIVEVTGYAPALVKQGLAVKRPIKK